MGASKKIGPWSLFRTHPHLFGLIGTNSSAPHSCGDSRKCPEKGPFCCRLAAFFGFSACFRLFFKPDFPILVFFVFLAVFRFAVFLAFLCVFALCSNDFKGSAERKILALFGGSLHSCQEKTKLFDPGAGSPFSDLF